LLPYAALILLPRSGRSEARTFVSAAVIVEQMYPSAAIVGGS